MTSSRASGLPGRVLQTGRPSSSAHTEFCCLDPVAALSELITVSQLVRTNAAAEIGAWRAIQLHQPRRSARDHTARAVSRPGNEIDGGDEGTRNQTLVLHGQPVRLETSEYGADYMAATP
jgi:hypothetical protein